MTAAPNSDDIPEPETTYNHIWSGLTAAQQDTAYKVFLALHPRPQALAWQPLLPRIIASPPKAPDAPPKVTVISDPDQPAREVAGIQSTCVATQAPWELPPLPLRFRESARASHR